MKTGNIGLWGDFVQITRLIIDDNKCLVDFDIRFEIDKEHGSSTVLIGENGTGKSSMLQAVLAIMLSFESDAIEKSINYRYSIEYYYKGSYITLKQSDKYYTVSIDDKPFCKGSLKTVKAMLSARNKSIFPERVSYFYSGSNDQARKNIHRADINYANKCRDAAIRYWNALYLTNHTYEGVFPKRKFNYCTEKLVPVYLIALLSGSDSTGKTAIIEQCHINHIETVSVSLSVKKLRNRLSNDIVEIGEEGIYDIISFIDDRFTDCFRRGFVYQNGTKFVFELSKLDQIEADTVSYFNFFEKLATILLAEYKVTVKVGESLAYCYNLSEGQRQLIKILGMLSVCKDEDTLVLMDEPDAHMNPRWKYELKSIIDRCLENAVNTQAVIATHDPLVINGVDKEFIRVFTMNPGFVEHNNWYFTKVIEPTENTEGLGIDGLLQSEYYGMTSVLDRETRKDMEEKQDLLVKEKDGELTGKEKARLKELSDKLDTLTFTRNIPTDSYYDEYVAAMHKVYRNRPKVVLTAEDIAERNARAEKIVKGLLEK